MKRPNGDRELTGLLLIITGTMGAGKTAVLGEASDILP
jgi:Ni2+-binding GTPase involved in maturation of urease and hydrogenase